MSEKERYASIGVWEIVFRREGHIVSYPTIKKYLEDAEIIGRTGRDRMGRVLEGGFYSESEVRKVLSGFLQDYPVADDNGLISLDGELYGTIHCLAQKIGITSSSVGLAIKKGSLSFVKGKSKQGKICHYYSLSRVSELFEYTCPVANENGFTNLDGEPFGTIKALSQALEVSSSPIKLAIKRGSPRLVRGRTKQGNIINFYSLSDIRELCKDLLQDYPVANENGFTNLDGEPFGTIKALSQELGVSSTPIWSVVRKGSPRFVRGRTKQGNILNLYSLSDIRELCKDLLQDYPVADDEGYIYLDGEPYGTVESLFRKFGVSTPTIKSRIKNNALKPIKGKVGGVILNFYSFAEVERHLFDNLKELPEIGRDGFVHLDGELYGSIGAISQHFGVSPRAIRSRIKESPLEPVEARSKQGRIIDLYSLSGALKHCSDFLGDCLVAKKPKK